MAGPEVWKGGGRDGIGFGLALQEQIDVGVQAGFCFTRNGGERQRRGFVGRRDLSWFCHFRCVSEEAQPYPRHCEEPLRRSNPWGRKQDWIASSQGLLGMTA